MIKLTTFCFNPKSNSPKKKQLPGIKYSAEDVVWAKFNRRPWWPCHVTIDPQIEVHTKMKGDLFCFNHILYDYS